MAGRERRNDELLKESVRSIADSMLARGLRPTPAQVEAQLGEPRHRIVPLLEEWAAALAERHTGDANDGLASLSRQSAGQATRPKPFAKLAEAVMLAGQQQAAARYKVRQLEFREELQLEIRRAREKLARLETSRGNDDDQREDSEVIRKIRDRLAALEKKAAGEGFE